MVEILEQFVKSLPVMEVKEGKEAEWNELQHSKFDALMAEYVARCVQAILSTEGRRRDKLMGCKLLILSPDGNVEKMSDIVDGYLKEYWAHSDMFYV